MAQSLPPWTGRSDESPGSFGNNWPFGFDVESAGQKEFPQMSCWEIRALPGLPIGNLALPGFAALQLEQQQRRLKDLMMKKSWEECWRMKNKNTLEMFWKSHCNYFSFPFDLLL
jgi:hypothetical protein